MIRRSFLRFLALSPLAALAAPQSARGQIVARAAGPVGVGESKRAIRAIMATPRHMRSQLSLAEAIERAECRFNKALCAQRRFNEAQRRVNEATPA